MVHAIPESHPLHRMFRGLAETTFMAELGIGDPKLVGYVADLLVRFVPSGGVWNLRDGQGRRVVDARRGRIRARYRAKTRVSSPSGRLHVVLDRRLSRSPPRPEGADLDRLSGQLPAARQTLILRGQYPRRSRRPRLPEAKRPVRTLRIRPVSRPQGVGTPRPRKLSGAGAWAGAVVRGRSWSGYRFGTGATP